MRADLQIDISRQPAFASSLYTWLRIIAAVLLTLQSVTHAQEPTEPAATSVSSGHNWASVKALPTNAKLHVTTDRGGKSCRVFAVTDDALTCAKESGAGATIQRTEIKHIKLTHHVRSTWVGAGVGAGIGAITGGIVGRNLDKCPTQPNFCIDIVGPVLAGVLGVSAGVVGAVAGGTTDFARGSSIYTRP